MTFEKEVEHDQKQTLSVNGNTDSSGTAGRCLHQPTESSSDSYSDARSYSSYRINRGG